ncbi:MAG: hypothetical protein COW12_04270 [Candidatus Omnitrophica bacterium CG12_big_fil_rev_8_21_14_0_65_45_16]|nr:MAG: hypothetical protein COW12_04270 [Candidatus Omnitrophica bacterium CG12_big_fil_rev_8_21_14_0_65_45_16]
MKAGIFTTTIEKIISQGPELKRFKLAFAPGTEFDFDAGQFASIMIPSQEPGKVVKRAYSIASPPQWKGSIELCLKLVKDGFATNYMWGLKEGDSVQIQAPLGRFVPKQPLPKTLVYVSTGTGIAPFRAIYHDLLSKGTPVEIWNIFGNRYEDEIIYKEEFEELARKHSNFKNVFTVSRPKTWTGEKEYVQFMLKKYIQNGQDKNLYICGLTNMINEVEKTALEIGFEKTHIHYEKYD